MVSMEENIEVHSVGGRPSRAMSRHTLAEVIEPRYQELFEYQIAKNNIQVLNMLNTKYFV